MLPEPIPSGETRRETGLAPPQPAGERWRHAFGLFKEYWTSKDWKFAWAALIVMVGFQFGGAYIFVMQVNWQQRFFDEVSNKHVAALPGLILAYAGILTLQVGWTVIDNIVSWFLGLRWRKFLTEQYIDGWMGRNRYVEIERLRLIDNPDQRIADDIRYVTDPIAGVFTLVMGTLSAIIMSASMIWLLLKTATTLNFTLFGHAISIPGSTVWYAFIYVGLMSVIITMLAKPVVRAKMRWQHREADFRTNLVHVRRNAPQIALADAVGPERAGLGLSFANIYRSYRSIILANIGLNIGTNSYDRIAAIFPMFIMMPVYFAGRMTFGQVMAGREAFGSLVRNLGYLVNLAPRVTDQVAFINRIKGLNDAIVDARPMGIAARVGTTPGVVMATEGLLLRRPHGEPLVDVGDWQVSSGERWMIRGPSGAGKSTLLRAMAGLWPEGNGAVMLADRTTAMFVPQRLYLPLGTLKAAICFPDQPEDHHDAVIAQLLRDVHLDQLVGEMHALRMWQEELSPGEQQRVSLARILLQRPTLLVLDEATSALDPANARHFHAMIDERLNGVTLVSIVHDVRLAGYYDHALTIAGGRVTAGAIGTDA